MDQVLVNQEWGQKFNFQYFCKMLVTPVFTGNPNNSSGQTCIIDVHYPVRLAKSMSFVSSYGPSLNEDGERSRKVSLASTWILTHLHVHHNAPVNISAPTYITHIKHMHHTHTLKNIIHTMNHTLKRKNKTYIIPCERQNNYYQEYSKLLAVTVTWLNSNLFSWLLIVFLTVWRMIYVSYLFCFKCMSNLSCCQS